MTVDGKDAFPLQIRFAGIITETLNAEEIICQRGDGVFPTGSARVATSQGVMEVVLDGGGNVGDRVSVRNGHAVQMQNFDDVAIHFV